MKKIIKMCSNTGLTREQKNYIVNSEMNYQQKVIGVLAFFEGLTEEQLKTFYKPDVDWFDMYCQEASLARGKEPVTIDSGVNRDSLFELIELTLS